MAKRSSLPQGVAGTPYGPDQLLLTGGVYLSPEVAYVDVDQVGRQTKLFVPHTREEEVAGENPPSISGHKLEQFELAGRKLYLPLSPPYLPGGRIDLKVGHPQELVSFQSS